MGWEESGAVPVSRRENALGMMGTKDGLWARLGRFVLDPSACALGDGPPLGEETLGIGDWGLVEKAEGSRTSSLHDLPSTIRAGRRFGRDVADLGMAGREPDDRTAITIAARLSIGAFVESRKYAEAKNADFVGFDVIRS